MRLWVKSLYRKIFPLPVDSLINPLEAALSDCHIVLELGCGSHSQLQYLSLPFSIGVDIFEPYLSESKKKIIHHQYIKGNVNEIEFKEKSVDAVVCLEVIEHLTKEEGYKLIKKMEKIARKKIILSTPNGYYPQNEYDGNPYQQHKSAWSIKDFKDLGFEVYGLGEFKSL